MVDPTELEKVYQEYINDLKKFVPDGIIEVDLTLLQELDLLSCEENSDSDLIHNFYVIESSDKLTLFNEKFVVWIVPQIIEQNPATFTLIALNNKGKTHLDMVFCTEGVYNQSSLVLRILEKFLDQIEENEQAINFRN